MRPASLSFFILTASSRVSLSKVSVCVVGVCGVGGVGGGGVTVVAGDGWGCVWAVWAFSMASA